MTPEKNAEFVKLMIWTIPTSRQEVIDDLNRQIKFIKGIDILTYYTPTENYKEDDSLRKE